MTAATGWAAWGAPRERRETPEPVQPGDQARYCPRCDAITIWEATGDGRRACNGLTPEKTCGVTLTTILSGGELDRLRTHYARSL